MNTTFVGQFKLLVIAGVFALLSGSLMTACSTSGSDRSETYGNKGVARVAEKTFSFKGTVVYHRDGDYFSIVSQRGEEYYPLNLKSSYRKSGLDVKVYGRTQGYAMGGKMRALEIWEISRPGNK